MKSTKRLVALILAMLMIISCVPLGIFAAEETATASTLVYESPIYEDETISGYKQYEAMWTDSTYVKGDVKYTVYFDTENATQTRDVVFYVINWNGERIGTDSDVDIVTDLIKADASVESGNRWAVVVVDFGGNPLAKSPNIEMSLAYLRAALPGASKLTVWTDSTHTTTKTVPVHKNHVYVLPAGYRVARDIPYFETDYHASLGTRNYVMNGWNSHIADKKKVYYAYHTGNDKCSFDHVTNANVECIAGAPQEIDGNVVKHSAGQLAPKVTRYEDMRKTDGSPLDYVCRLDIIYPSGENVEATPVMVQAATQSPRMSNVGTVGSDDYDKDGESSLKVRAMLVGMEFSGYTVAVYDYAYSPMARGDHYGYIDPYGAHGSNAAKTSRAAIRCIRYFAEQYGYNDSLIGAAGISKGTPTTAILSTVDNKYVDEASSFNYDIDGDGPGTAVSTRDVWYEGDINAEGIVTTESTTVVQPYLTYEAGYNGKHIDGDDVNYAITRTGEISSEVNVVYCAAGDGINRVYKGDESIILGGTNPTTGEETQHVPMILSCGYYDEYGCWDHWPSIQARFTEYAENPFIAIGMEDMGHDYPSGIDPMRDYDRYNAYMQFFHSILKPELYTPQVAWMMPVDGAKNVSVVENIQVQLIKPATTLAAFEGATTVKDSYGNEVEGTWSTNASNTSGLYTFVPDNGYTGGVEYTVTVGTPVVATATSKSFTAEAAGFLRPIADTYVSEIYKDGVFGTEKTLYIDNQRTYLATFNTADFEDANRAKLALPLTGTGSQTLSVYVLDGFKVDESKTCYNNMPELTDSKLVGTYDISEGDSTVDLLDIVSRVSSEQFTLAIKGSAQYYKLDFEEFSAGTVIVDYNTGTKPQPADAPGADDCYSPNYIWRTGGATGTMTAVNDPDGTDNIVASVVSGKTYNRIRWYNTFVRDKAYLDSTDIGKTFNLSFDLRIKVPDSSAPQMGYALDAAGGTLATFTPKPTADTWTNVTKSFVIDEDIISTNGTATKRGILSFTLNGAIGSTYYFDDIIVSEAAPTTLISREDTSDMTAYISTTSVSEDGIVADAYVSKAQPDTALGLDNRLMLNGGDDENIIFLTYPSKLIEGKTDLQFTVPAEDDASVKAEVLLLDGYFVDEERLTYNNMPDLSKAVSLGEYTLKGGVNIIEAENAVSKIKGNYFTVVFKATDSIETVYFKNFEDYAVGDNVDVTSYNVTDSTTTNADGKNYTYYYAHLAEGTDSKRYLARSGGAAAISNPLGNVLVDPSDDNNQIINLKLGTGNYNGRIKFYNSISDSVMTETDTLIGQTLRFTAKVKAGSQTTVNNACAVYACPMLSAGSAALTDANKKSIKSQTIIVNNEWQTVTVDYTVAAKDIKVDTTANGNPAWGYPAFTLEFNNTNLSNTYLIDDLTVVKLNSDGTVSRLDMASSEGAEHAGETIGLRARKSKDPVADTYISAANKDGVFGFEKTLYADSQRTYLATFKTSDFSITDKGYLLLPLSGSGSQTLSVYLLDGFAVDENATCYNNTPELTDDKLIDTVEALEGEKKINLNTILSGVTDDYFTIAIKGTAHCFEENFDNFTVDTSLKVFNSNNTYSDSDYEALKNGACSTENFVWRTGGATPTLYAKADPADSTNKVAYVQSNYTYNRIKWYNSFVKGDKLYFGQEDLGKTFNVSYKVRVSIPSGVVVNKLSISHEMSKGVSNDYYGHKATPLEANTWTTINTSFTVNQSMIDNKSGMFGFMLGSTVLTIDGNTPTNASSNKFKYYFDDIVVSEEAAGEIASLDALIEKIPYVISTKDIVADTYVSKGNPDTCYGDEEVLKLGDKGGDKKALVLSFMNSALDASNYVELNLNNGGDALKDVSVYYILDYCADESTL
ncbi:MAG: Ig-like domain-containing protein, partial [Clostridia bacterium]|nr:Ig-like domain-containing protein [Clostridia bacterium]